MTRITENNAMVHVMFACFVVMFAITAMDVKKHMHRRFAPERKAIVTVIGRPPAAVPGRQPRARVTPQAEAERSRPPAAMPTSSFWESAAGVPEAGGLTLGDLTITGIEIKPLCVDEDAPALPLMGLPQSETRSGAPKLKATAIPESDRN